jgi:predicted nucleotidyltransferase
MDETTPLVLARRFHALIQKLEPRAGEIRVYESHKRSATSRLQSAFGIKRVPLIGSYIRGSAVRRYSDIDLMPAFPVALVRWGRTWKSSTTVLEHLRGQLLDRYTQTEVGRDNQAIVIRFGDGQHPVDVIPAVYVGPGINNYPIHAIPDGNGWWRNSSPYVHNRFINNQNLRSGGKLRSVVKLVKFWRYCRLPHIPLNSFHVELLLSQTRICFGAKSYSRCFTEILELLFQRQCRSLNDPLRIAGNVKAANTDSKRHRTLRAVEASLTHAYRALHAEIQGQPSEATRQWEIVFNGFFTGSGYPD